MTLRLSETELHLLDLTAVCFEASIRKRGGPLMDYKLGPDFAGWWKPELS